jgi:hypothetical protein
MTSIYNGYVYEQTPLQKAKNLLRRLEKATSHEKAHEAAVMYLDRCGEINEHYVRLLGEHVFDIEQETYSTKGPTQ